MLTEEEKKFFINTALGVCRLSKCPIQQGAVLIRGSRILSHGFNRKIIADKEWEISAIYDAIFSARDSDLTGTDLFSTYFPSLEEMKLIIAVGIKTFRFLGKITHPETVQLLNSLPGPPKSIEIIKIGD